MLKRLVFPLLLIVMIGKIVGQPIQIRFPRWREVDCHNNVSVSLGGGAGGILMNNTLLNPTLLGQAGNAGVAYVRMFNPNKGVRLGIGVHYMSSGFSLGGTQTMMTGRVKILDETGEKNVEADMMLTSGGFSERYEMMMLEAPIQIVYAYEHFFVYGGMRLGMPLRFNARYSYDESRLDLVGIPATGTVLEEPLCMETYAGDIGIEPEVDWSGGRVFGTLAIEGGYRWSIGKRAFLQVGMYVDYAVKGLRSGCEGMYPWIQLKGEQLVTVTPMQSNLMTGYTYISFGVKVGCQWGVGTKVGEYNRKKNYSMFGGWLRDLNYKKLLRRMNR